MKKPLILNPKLSHLKTSSGSKTCFWLLHFGNSLVSTRVSLASRIMLCKIQHYTRNAFKGYSEEGKEGKKYHASHFLKQLN